MTYRLPAVPLCYNYYPMTADNTDASGNGRTADDGTGTPTYTFPGRFNQANGMLIDGTENIKYAGCINLDTTDFTGGVWYKSDALANLEDHRAAIWRSNGGGLENLSCGFYYLSATPVLSVLFDAGTGSAFTYDACPRVAGSITDYLTKWHLFGISSRYSDNTVFFYIDGVCLNPAGSAGGTVDAGENACYVGAFSASYIPHGHLSDNFSIAKFWSQADWRKFYAWQTGKI